MFPQDYEEAVQVVEIFSIKRKSSGRTSHFSSNRITMEKEFPQDFEEAFRFFTDLLQNREMLMDNCGLGDHSYLRRRRSSSRLLRKQSSCGNYAAEQGHEEAQYNLDTSMHIRFL